jgi:hypothetical protein
LHQLMKLHVTPSNYRFCQNYPSRLRNLQTVWYLPTIAVFWMLCQMPSFMFSTLKLLCRVSWNRTSCWQDYWCYWHSDNIFIMIIIIPVNFWTTCYSRPTSFVGSCVTVSLIQGRIVVAALVHCSVVPLLIYSHARVVICKKPCLPTYLPRHCWPWNVLCLQFSQFLELLTLCSSYIWKGQCTCSWRAYGG